MLGGVRRDVASVREGVDPRVLRHPLTRRQVEQRAQVIDVRVDAAVGDEAEEMNVGATLASPSERGHERLVREERAVGDRSVHALEILEQDPPGADREMPDLGVAHLPRGSPTASPGRAAREVCG